MRHTLSLLASGLTVFCQFIERPTVNAVVSFGAVFVMMFLLIGARFQ